MTLIRSAILMTALFAARPDARGPNLGVPPKHSTLPSLRDLYRPLLIFSPNDGDARLQQQISFTDDHKPGLAERQVILIAFFEHGATAVGATAFYPDGTLGYLTKAEGAAARRRFHIAPGDFTVILLGKDGGEKLCSHDPIPFATLRDTIDAMPMRQQEMRTPK